MTTCLPSVRPPVPEEHWGRFCINGQLLQGYTIQTPEPLEPDKEAVDALLSCLDDMDICGDTLDSPTEQQAPVPTDTAPEKAPAQKTIHPKQKKQSPTR